MIIKNTANVTEFDLQVIKIVPKIFYTGDSKYQLNSAFSVMQHIIFYGTNILGSYTNDIKAILVLCLVSMNTLTHNGTQRPESDCV